MRPVETLLLFANLLTFFVLAVPRLRAMRWTRYLALITLLIAGAQALVEGPRDDGSDCLQPEASLAFPDLKIPGMTCTFMGPQPGGRMNITRSNTTEKSASCITSGCRAITGDASAAHRASHILAR
jgi:hypothetical protein